MASRVERKGPGMAQILKRLKDAAVTVGIHSDEGMHDDAGMTVAAVGAVNEFGSSDGHIPERSFMRTTMTEQRPEYIKTMQQIAKSAIQGKYTPEVGMVRLGRKAEGDIKKKIRDIDTPENAESTKRQKKGADNPLVDSEQMLNSIRWKHEKD